MKDDFILRLYSHPESVFTVDEIAQLFTGISSESIRDRLYYFAKVGKLQRLRHGIYAKAVYNPLELANKLYKPAYISLETVLTKEGIVFQYYETIFAVSYLTRSIAIDKTEILYRQLKGSALTNTDGIEEKVGYFIATRERAFLDAVYIYKDYHFDNLGTLDWGKAEKLKKIYKNSAFEKRVEDYYKLFKEDHAHN